MRYINIEDILIPNPWRGQATNLLNQLRGFTRDEQKKQLIKANPIWKELRVNLRDLFYDKCCYSEAKIVGFIPHIDHFRPKCRAKDLDGTNHMGYWWVAYNVTNYRLSCEFTNCRRTGHDQVYGKGDYFPLAADCSRCSNESDNLNNEKNLILDPCNLNDVSLLSFDIDGRAICLDDNPNVKIRVNTTIELLHLNYIDFVNGRIAVINGCRRLVQDLINILDDLSENETARKIEQLNTKITQIQNKFSIDKPYSKCAEDFFRNQPRQIRQYIFSDN